MYNDPNVTNGSEPGSTFQPNNDFPSRSVEAHQPKRYNPRDGHKVILKTIQQQNFQQLLNFLKHL